MSFNSTQINSIVEKAKFKKARLILPITTTTSPTVDTWVRNPAWEALPSVSSGDQKLVGLIPVYDNSTNYLAVRCSGNYTVNWGDGDTENFNAAVTATHNYSFSDAGLSVTDRRPVTFTASTSKVNRTSHGYSNGNRVAFFNIATTTGLLSNTEYYVVNAATNDFQISRTEGGTALTLTNDGGADLLPYKQAIVVITPQAGQNLTSVELLLPFSAVTTFNSPWLDVAYSLNNITLSPFRPTTSAYVARHLERVNVVSQTSVTSLIPSTK
jgi:hypothetical protein